MIVSDPKGQTVDKILVVCLFIHKMFVLIYTVFILKCIFAEKSPPHIILILADDLGWNDVSFHGSDEIPTPNIDALAYNGVILNQHYTMPMCTPSRAALLTGKYPIHLGMHHYVIRAAEPWGIDPKEKILPQLLSEAGYESHIVGKWHLGFYKKEYTPTMRGFKSHHGFWQSHHDYYSHYLDASPSYYGYDMRKNMDVDWSSNGTYSTDVFTQTSIEIINKHNKSHPLFLFVSHLAPHSGITDEPFQAPEDIVQKFNHIKDQERKIYAGMVAKLDESVGDIIEALSKKEMLDNSVVVFLSDNGAPTIGMHYNKGSNFPLRGIKSTVWEGGNRGVAAIWSPLIKQRQRVHDQMIHITDWLPTFYGLSGLTVSNLNIDGIDMWKTISENLPSPRTSMLYNIDVLETPYSAFRLGKWKYISGFQDFNLSGWYGRINDSNPGYNTDSVILSKVGKELSRYSENQTTFEISKLRKQSEIKCDPDNFMKCDTQKICLFNLEDDPCEFRNVAEQNPTIIKEIEDHIDRYRKSMKDPRNKPSDVKANPIFWNNTWSTWM